METLSRQRPVAMNARADDATLITRIERSSYSHMLWTDRSPAVLLSLQIVSGSNDHGRLVAF